jgi:hypothetical protein
VRLLLSEAVANQNARVLVPREFLFQMLLEAADYPPLREVVFRMLRGVAEALPHEELLEMLMESFERHRLLTRVTLDLVDRLRELAQLPADISSAEACDILAVEKPLTPDEVRKKYRKGLGHKPTRTPDLEWDRQILRWVTANPPRTWSQAGEHFLGDPAKGDYLSGQIGKHKKRGCYDSDPELAALYELLKSQKRPGRKKKYPPN